jgi:WD40 repeat protein
MTAVLTCLAGFGGGHANGQGPVSLDGPDFFARHAVFSPDGKRVAILGFDYSPKRSPRPVEKVVLWDLPEAKERPAIALAGLGTPLSIALSPDGKRLIACSDVAHARPPRDGAYTLLQVWDVGTQQLLKSFKLPGEQTFQAVCLPDGNTVLLRGRDDLAVLFDLEQGKEISRLPRDEPYDNPVLSPDGTHLAVVIHERQIAIWDIVARKRVADCPDHKSKIAALCFSPDGKVLYSACPDGALFSWEATTGRLRSKAKLDLDPDATATMAFDPTSPRLAIGHAGRTPCVSLWEWTAPELDPTFKRQGVNGRIREMVFAPDGKHFVTLATDRSVRLWKVPPYQPKEK